MAGFCVNMFGIAVFRHNHSHGGGGHGHSHGGSSHSHSRDDHAHSHAHDDHAHSHSHGSGHHDDHHHGHSHSEHKSKKRHESLADDGHLNSNMQGMCSGQIGKLFTTNYLFENKKLFNFCYGVVFVRSHKANISWPGCGGATVDICTLYVSKLSACYDCQYVIRRCVSTRAC